MVGKVTGGGPDSNTQLEDSKRGEKRIQVREGGIKERK